MDNKKIENLLDATYEILLGQNNDIERYEKELKELEETLNENEENFFILRGLDEVMVISLQEVKKDYFFKHINNFIAVHTLSGEIKGYTMNKLNETFSDETEDIRENSKYNDCLKEMIKLENEMREKFSDDENTIFGIYSDTLANMQSEKNSLFYIAMLQSGLCLNKIKEVVEV